MGDQASGRPDLIVGVVAVAIGLLVLCLVGAIAFLVALLNRGLFAMIRVSSPPVSRVVSLAGQWGAGVIIAVIAIPSSEPPVPRSLRSPAGTQAPSQPEHRGRARVRPASGRRPCGRRSDRRPTHMTSDDATDEGEPVPQITPDLRGERDGIRAPPLALSAVRANGCADSASHATEQPISAPRSAIRLNNPARRADTRW
uniref:hypothetical protein n=1 Tax=Nonomuraea bangladeshensis TaxID=404385 RepID=UPI003F49A8C2